MPTEAALGRSLFRLQEQRPLVIYSSTLYCTAVARCAFKTYMVRTSIRCSQAPTSRRTKCKMQLCAQAQPTYLPLQNLLTLRHPKSTSIALCTITVRQALEVKKKSMSLIRARWTSIVHQSATPGKTKSAAWHAFMLWKATKPDGVRDHWLITPLKIANLTF